MVDRSFFKPGRLPDRFMIMIFILDQGLTIVISSSEGTCKIITYKKVVLPMGKKSMNLAPSLLRSAFETELDRKSRGVKIFQFFAPWVLWAILASSSALFFYMVQNWESAKNLLYVWFFYMIPPMGKEVIIPKILAETHHPPALVVAFTTAVVDMIISLFLIWNYDWVKRIPVLGKKLEETELRGRERIRKTRWFSKASFVATAFFVFIPFSGAGGFGGTVLGRLMGVKPYKVLLAVAIGASIEALLYAFLADIFLVYLEGSSFFIWFSNINILQIFGAFVMLALITYVVRHPKEAVVKTSIALRTSIDVSENAVLKMEGMSKDTTHFSVMEAKKTLFKMRGLEDDVMGEILGNEYSPLKVLDTVDDRILNVMTGVRKDSRDLAREFIDESMVVTGDIADKTLETGSKISIIGHATLKEGVERSEYIILMVEDHVERIFNVKDLLKKK